ncbi:MAG: large subunit ribosomal protein [Frankiaceae bacterium]|nr:large subunit ribosomal protein [Frankiaceae bacterium]
MFLLVGQRTAAFWESPYARYPRLPSEFAGRPTPLENPVASVCDICGKGPGFGMSVSHSHRRTRRRFNPNVQSVRALVGRGTRKRMNVCTSCIKAGKVTR